MSADARAVGELERAARAAVEGALRRGATGAQARAGASRAVSLVYRDGAPERVEESARRQLALHLYVDGRYSTCVTNHLDPVALDAFLDRAVALARAVEPDPDRQLPDPSLYDGRWEGDLALVDPDMARLTAAERHRFAAALCDEVRVAAGPDLDVRSVEARAQDSESTTVHVASNGPAGGLPHHHETQHWGYASVTLQDRGDRRPAGWAIAGARRRAELDGPGAIARQAVESARARLGSGPIETAQLPIVVENRAVGRLLGHLLAGLDGRRLQQRASFLEGRRGQQVGSALLDVTDDPLAPGGFGSRRFDVEGLASRPLRLFREGVLESCYLDTYYARKLGERPTTGDGSNVVITPGEATLDELVASIDRGLLVRGFLGGNSNPTTGDFSLGVHGTLIEQGKLTAAVSEMNVAGNHLELWRRLTAVGADVYRHSPLRSPSLLFDLAQLSGR
jgi:PmbA protein